MNALLALVLAAMAQAPLDAPTPSPPAATPTSSVAPAPAAAVPLMLVLDVAGEHVAVEQRQGLTEALALSLMGRLDLDVQSPRSLMERVNFAEQQQQAGCDSSACMSEIANAMGARFVVFTRIVKLGDDQVLRADVFDSVAGRSVALSGLQGRSVDDLSRRLPVLVDALVLESRGQLPVRTVQRTVIVPDTPMSSMTKNGLLIGGAGLGVGVVFGGLFVAGNLRSNSIVDASEAYARTPTIDNARAVVEARGPFSRTVLGVGTLSAGCLGLAAVPALVLGAGMVIADAVGQPQQQDGT